MKPSSMPAMAKVDQRFQSYNVEMVEIIGGRFWKPYSQTPVKDMPATAGATLGSDPALYEQRTPVDLSNPRLRLLASALGPAYLRVSGSWANTAYFQDTDADTPAKPPTGFGGVLTRAEWNGVAAFAKATDAKLVTSFAVSPGTRDAQGTWTAAQAEAFLAYSKRIGAPIAAAEFFNEPTFAAIAGLGKGYDGAAYGRDFAVFQKMFRREEPGALLLGPGSVGEGIPLDGGGGAMHLLSTDDLLRGTGAAAVDVFSYHFYPSVSERCAAHSPVKIGTSPEEALSAAFLQRTNTVEAFYAGLRDRYAAGKPMWVTETGQAACGGDRWAATFLDSFRYLYQLGSLAQHNVQVVMHNTLAASDYGLIDEKSLEPRPNYWAALIWHKLMAETVLNPGTSPSETLPVFAQCMRGHPGGVTLLALNLQRTGTQSIQVPLASTRYVLTAPSLPGRSVQLNGRELALTAAGTLPELPGVATKAGTLELPAASITFVAIPAAGNAACR